MSDKLSLVEDEINEHKSDLETWVSSVKSFTVSSSCQRVVDRFVRDCNTLITDIDDVSEPSAADLNDYQDRKHSLEVQYNTLSQNHQ